MTPKICGPWTIGIVCATALLACADRQVGEDAGEEGGTGTTGGAETSGTPTTSGAPGTSEPLPGSTSTGTVPEPGTGDATSVETTVEEESGDMDPVACDVFAQDCPAGQKCAPYSDNGGSSWNALKCVPVTGDGQPGEPCTAQESGFSGLDDCAKGVFCWEVDETLQGTCTELCGGPEAEPTCEDPEVSCLVSGEGVLSLCLPPCDPLTQDCPGGEDLCIPVPAGETFACVLDASGDEGQVFDPCEFANTCDKGLYCLPPELGTECDPGAGGCCLPFCDLADADVMCPGVGQSCVSFFGEGMAPPKYANVGICVIEP